MRQRKPCLQGSWSSAQGLLGRACLGERKQDAAQHAGKVARKEQEGCR